VSLVDPATAQSPALLVASPTRYAAFRERFRNRDNFRLPMLLIGGGLHPHLSKKSPMSAHCVAGSATWVVAVSNASQGLPVVR